MVTVGLFNVLAAIFVQSTLEAAAIVTTEKKARRMNDPKLWSTRITILIRKLFEYHGTMIESSVSESLDSLASVSVSEIPRNSS